MIPTTFMRRTKCGAFIRSFAMNIPDQMNVQAKPIMDIKGGLEKQPLNKSAETKDGPPSAVIGPDQTLLEDRTRNIRFRVNNESKEMYVEVTNSDNEVIRTIPADENDPKFMSLVQQSKPGSFIDRTG